MSSDRKGGGSGGQSDRTVMLTTDDLAAGNRTAPSVEPFKDPDTLDEDKPGGARPAPVRKTGQRPALGEPAPAPRAPTGQRPALGTEPAAPKPRVATGQRPAIKPPEPAKRAATGQRPALPKPDPVDPSLGGETMLLGSAPPGGGGNETRIFDTSSKGLASDDGGTAAGNLAGDDKPTTAKRPLQDLVESGPEIEATSTTGHNRIPKRHHDGPETSLTGANKGITGIQILVGALLLVVVGGFAAKMVLHATAKPSDDELRLLYPYGNRGGLLTNGRHAPPVSELNIDFVGPEQCDATRCLRYKATHPGHMFEYDMVVKQTDEGWALDSSRSGGR